MFIYSKFSSFGVETPEKLVHLLANEGIQAICLIDEFGLGLPAFLHTCKKRKVKASIAIPFSSFIEGEETKAAGYFVVVCHEHYTLIAHHLDTMKQDFIPILTEKQLTLWAKQGIYCLVRTGNDCFEYCSKARLAFNPVAYVSHVQKEETFRNAMPIMGVALEECFTTPETLIFVEGVSKSPDPFLEALRPVQKTVNLSEYRQKKQQLSPRKHVHDRKEDMPF